MKIKYKLILILISVIVAASLPLSLFILKQQERDKISVLTHHGESSCRILARSMLNIILMNGADIETSIVDAKEMISILKPLTNDGLVYADAILLSSNDKYNGIVLASYLNSDILSDTPFSESRISGEDLDLLKEQKSYTELYIPQIQDVCYQFTAAGSLPGRPPLCIGRLVFSKGIILSSIRKLRIIIFGATALAIVVVGMLGLFFSRYISNPIAGLTAAARRIKDGDFNYEIATSSRDEIGELSLTFNHMSRIINLKIAELVISNKKLAQLDKLKDEFLANVSHELRTPLNGMIGIAESLIDGAAGPLRDEEIHDLHLIVSSGKRLMRLVNDILDFSRLKHSEIELQFCPVSMYDITQLVISIIKPLTRNRPVRIINGIPPDFPAVYGDENRLQQIMLNLLGNAIKFTEKGEIVISADESDEADGMVVISIKDTGIGIPDDLKDVVFETFRQADGSSARIYSGVGLGLAITKNLVDLHNGKIWFESESGEGAVFFFTLPRSAEGMEVKGSCDGMDVSPLIIPDYPADIRLLSGTHNMEGDNNKKKLLIVDDEPVNLQVLINHLTLEGYIIETALEATEALRRLDEQKPDLILLDVMLPRISGYDLCRMIREKYKHYEMPVLMLTAKNSVQDMLAGFDAGANDYISKPVNKDELLVRVKNLVFLKDSVQMHDELNRIKYELDIANEIQSTILEKEPPRIKGMDLAVRYEPVIQIGGDFYHFHSIDENKFGILIADVSGHGIPAAIINSKLELAHTFFIKDSAVPGNLFEGINSIMSSYSHGHYVTACYVYIDLLSRRLLYSNAGHKPMLIYRKKSKDLLEVHNYGKPLGIFPDMKYKTGEVYIDEGDWVILFTDGVTDVRNEKKEVIGEERFYKLILENSDLSADGLADTIIEHLHRWAGQHENISFNDDVTLILLHLISSEENG